MTKCLSNSVRILAEKDFELKALSHGAIFLATCNAFLLLRDVNL